MVFVVDASVTMSWCFEDEARPVTDDLLARLTSETILVPALWTHEVANVLLVSERRGRMSESQAARFVELLRQLPIRIDSAPVDMGTLLAIGRRHNLSAYDAAYLALAERLGVALATVDQDLAEAARSAGVILMLE